MPVRMKDIAQELGVSVVTVSKVLRNHPDVSAQTRERVMQKITEMNYRPNFAARALVTGKTYTIGLVVPDLVHSFFADVAKGASQVLRRHDYHLLISSSEESHQLEAEELEKLMARRVDAILIASTCNTPELMPDVGKQKVPFVFIDRHFPGYESFFVGVDDEAVGFLATTHLIDVGCQRIAHIGGTGFSTAEGRQIGFRKALASRQIEVNPDYIMSRIQLDEGGDDTGYEAMQKLLRLDPRPDGVVCFNDATAMGALKAALHAGLQIPSELKLIGAGNTLYSDFFRVPLSSIDQNSRGIGEAAANLALELINSHSATPESPRSILLEPKLVVRESSGGPPPSVP